MILVTKLPSFLFTLKMAVSIKEPSHIYKYEINTTKNHLKPHTVYFISIFEKIEMAENIDN